MKTLRILLCALPLIAFARAGDSDPDPLTTDVFTARYTAEQLDQLLGPIALYPDALIAIILPACTAPTDIVLAARHLRDNGNDLSAIESRPWDDSVKSLAHYPDVLKWLDENLPWTQQVGEAFLAQPAEVMQSIQRLRAKARAAGTLVDTPQQVVVAEPEVIRIVPAQPDIIYVPYYDPAVVFIDRPYYYSSPFISFSTGFAVGSWLAYDFDWSHRTIWVGSRFRPWHRHDWRLPVVPIRPPVVRSSPPSWLWKPSPRIHRTWHSDNGNPVHRATNVWQHSTPPRAPIAQPHTRTFAAPTHRGGGSTYASTPKDSRTAPEQDRTSPASPRSHVRTNPTPPPASTPAVTPPRGRPPQSNDRIEARTHSRVSSTPTSPPAVTPPANFSGRSRPSSSPTAAAPPVAERAHTPRTRAPGSLSTDALGHSRSTVARTPRADSQGSPRTFAPVAARTHEPGSPRTTPPPVSRTSRVDTAPSKPAVHSRPERDSSVAAAPVVAPPSRGGSIGNGSRRVQRDAL